MQTLKFKNLKDLSKYIAFTIIDTNLMNNKRIPIIFEWGITDIALKHLPDKQLVAEIKKDRESFNEMVLDRAYQIIDNMMAEDFFVIEEDEFLRLKTEEEIQNEIKAILDDSSETF